MNTRRMLDAARADKLKPEMVKAYCIWALVSQMGRDFMAVGEVASIVKQTSGSKPSTYQVNRVLAELHEMGAVHNRELRRNAKGIVMGWKANDLCIGLLYVYQWHFVRNEEFWNSVYSLTEKVNLAVMSIAKNLEQYNRDIDETAEIINHE